MNGFGSSIPINSIERHESYTHEPKDTATENAVKLNRYINRVVNECYSSIEEFHEILQKIILILESMNEINENVISTDYINAFFLKIHTVDSYSQYLIFTIIAHSIFKSNNALLNFKLNKWVFDILFKQLELEFGCNKIKIILNIFMKIIESNEENDFVLEYDIIDRLFNLFLYMLDNESFKDVYFLIYENVDSFVRNYNNNYIGDFLKIILQIIHKNILESSLAFYIVPILCDISAKGFNDILISNNYFRICIENMENISFLKAFGYILKFILLIIRFDSNQIQFISLMKMNEILYKYSDYQNDVLLLFHEIVLNGFLVNLLNESEQILIKVGTYCNFEKQQITMKILWEGLSKLEKNEDKFNVVNREIFSAIMGNVYNFDDEIIIIALKCLLNLINNSQYSEISEKSKKIIFDICNECIQNTNDQIEIISNEILNILH